MKLTIKINFNRPTYIPKDDLFQIIMKHHNQFMTSAGLEMWEEDQRNMLSFFIIFLPQNAIIWKEMCH